MELPNLDTLKQNFSGEIITPEDAAYDSVRSSFSYEGSPAAVLRPRTSGDVASVVRFAKDAELILSVRSGGHGGGGFSTNKDGVVIDLALMNQIEVIDGTKRIVRIGSGATWGQVSSNLQSRNWAISSGDTKSVGVGGLTLGGGIGWMVRKFGLALDNVVGVEVVTASGEVLIANETENPDLFWATRGGGGNFGVVTYFEFVAQPVKKFFTGTFIFDTSNIRELLAGWRDYMRTATDDLNSTVMVMPSFGGNPPSVMMLNCFHCETETQAQEVFAPLLKRGKLLSQTIAEKKYMDVLEDAHKPEGIEIISHNAFAKDLSDELIALMAANHGQETSPMLMLRYLKGALNDVAVDATAFAHRDAEIMLMSVGFFPMPAPATAAPELLEKWNLYKPYTQGTYINFSIEMSPEVIANIYPEKTYRRLAEIKKKYDPGNLFRQNFNIKPV